jgi:phospholipid/cholesterol/gamma-HCH transport system substrate-binding protein
MKNVRLNYLIVGTFMIGVFAVLVVAVALLTGRTGATDDYYTVYDNVTGVEFGTRVLYEGYPIGQVQRIVPQSGEGKIRFRVDLSVIEGWKIAKDSVTEIAASGLLSAVTINVRAGESREVLKPGGEIASRESGSVMVAVGDLARDVKSLTESDIKPLMARLNGIVAGISDMMGTDGTAAAGDLKTMIQTVTQATPDIVENLSAFSAKLSQSSAQFDRLLSEQNVQAIEGIIRDMGISSTNMSRLTEQLVETRKSLDGLIANVGVMVGDNKLDVERTIIEMRHSFETVARHIDAINENMEMASRNMAEFTRAIRQNPGLLLGGTPPADNARPK